ncbi:MAG: outer membrane beta-barrel protein [Bacteroidota bacterium]
MKTGYSFILNLKFLLLVFFSSFSLVSLAQETSTCAENLRNAQTLFDNGQVEQVPAMLEECLRSGFKQEEELSAYKLIIQTFLFQDRNAEADSAMLAFLKKYPEYELSPTDHSSFVYLFNNFRVRPIIQVAVHFGTNIPFLTFTNRAPYTVAGEKGSNDYSVNLFNLYFSVETKFRIGQKLELNMEPGFSQVSFTNTRQILPIGITNYTETQSRLEIPLTAAYDLKTFGKLTLYGRAGLGPAISLRVTSTPSFDPADLNGTPKPGSDIDRRASRISLDLFAQTGAGIKFKTQGGYIFSELRLNTGIFDQVIRAGISSADEQELAIHYNYADDHFNINAINFTIGYTQIFYKPTKK